LQDDTEKLVQFAEEKELSFDNEKDLATILQHYDKSS